MICKLCSTTISEWPTAKRASKQSRSCTMSEKCSPVVGSSRMKRQRPPLALLADPAPLHTAAPPLDPALHLPPPAEKRERLAHGHLQHLGDVAPAVGDVEDLLAVTRTA